MSKQQNYTRQQIDQKRGAYSHARKKKFVYLRNTKQYEEYRLQRKGIKKKEITIKSSEGPSILQVKKQSKLSFIIKKLFKRKNHAENIL